MNKLINLYIVQQIHTYQLFFFFGGKTSPRFLMFTLQAWFIMISKFWNPCNSLYMPYLWPRTRFRNIIFRFKKKNNFLGVHLKFEHHIYMYSNKTSIYIHFITDQLCTLKKSSQMFWLVQDKSICIACWAKCVK